MVEREEVIKLARLSKLAFSPEEIDRFTVDMQAIVAFADRIAAAEGAAEGAPEPDSRLRDDVVGKSFSQEEILRNAPGERSGFFHLPKEVQLW